MGQGFTLSSLHYHFLKFVSIVSFFTCIVYLTFSLVYFYKEYKIDLTKVKSRFNSSFTAARQGQTTASCIQTYKMATEQHVEKNSSKVYIPKTIALDAENEEKFEKDVENIRKVKYILMFSVKSSEN